MRAAMADLDHNQSPPPAEPGQFALRALLVCTVVLGLLPLWTPDWLGLFDLGAWLHQATLIADWQRQPLYPQVFERVAWPTPMWLVPNLLSALGYSLELDTAARLLLSVCLAAVPFASLLLARAAGHSAWLALGAAVWMWHHDVALGHLPSVVALPLLLVLLSVHLHGLIHRFRWPLAVLFGLSTLLVLTHPVPWLVAAVGVPLLGAVVRLGAARRPIGSVLGWLLAEVLALGLPVLLLVPWWQERVRAAGSSRLSWESNLPVANLHQLTDRLFDIFTPHHAALRSLGDLLVHRAGDMVSFLWLFGLGLWLLGAIREGRSAPERPLPQRIGGSYLGWAVVFALVGYFALPVTLLRPVWLAGLNVRLTSLLGILAVLALPIRPLQPPSDAKLRTWLGTAAMLVAAAWMPISVWRAQTLVASELGEMQEAFSQVPAGKKLLVLRQTADSRWHRYRVFHELQRWYPVWRGGLIGGGFPDADWMPVRWKPGAALPLPPPDDHNSLRWREEGRFYDYVAVWRDPFQQAPLFEAQLQGLQQTWRRGRWSIWHNKDAAQWPELGPPPPPPPPQFPGEPEGRSEKIGLGLLDDWLRTAGMPATPPADPGDYARAVKVLRWRLQWRDLVVPPARSGPAKPAR